MKLDKKDLFNIVVAVIVLCATFYNMGAQSEQDRTIKYMELYQQSIENYNGALSNNLKCFEIIYGK